MRGMCRAFIRWRRLRTILDDSHDEAQQYGKVVNSLLRMRWAEYYLKGLPGFSALCKRELIGLNCLLWQELECTLIFKMMDILSKEE